MTTEKTPCLASLVRSDCLSQKDGISAINYVSTRDLLPVHNNNEYKVNLYDETDRETDRQTERQTNRQAGRQADRQTGTNADISE